MQPLFNCEINYFPSQHLTQIYDGFEKLRKIGIVNISLKPTKSTAKKPILKVKVNNKHTIIYDTLDGFNWINGTIDDNLEYFRTNIHADYYFKRSYNQQILDFSNTNCRIYPLGLNYSFEPEGKFPKTVKETFKDLLKNTSLVKKYYQKKTFCYKDFEFLPIPLKQIKVLFIAGLWNPNNTSSEYLKRERALINKHRISAIRACQKEFGKQFTGGLQRNSFSSKNHKELTLPYTMTNKASFLKAIKTHSICIATTGLHHSTGWKFGEYVAASRAIVSEPLAYDLPGDFKSDKNYLAFNNEEELLSKIHFLLKNKDAVVNMMNNNYQYYHNYLRPDKLVLNTLLKIQDNGF